MALVGRIGRDPQLDLDAGVLLRKPVELAAHHGCFRAERAAGEGQTRDSVLRATRDRPGRHEHEPRGLHPTPATVYAGGADELLPWSGQNMTPTLTAKRRS
jgi:hypothetical protein